MGILKIFAVVMLLLALLVQYATKLATLNAARYLERGRHAEDERLDVPALTLHPAPNLDLLWGSLDGLPMSLRRTIFAHRTATGLAALAGLAVFGLFAFG